MRPFPLRIATISASLFLSTNLSSQWLKLPSPWTGPSFSMCAGMEVNVPREAVPFGFGRIFYSANCQVGSHGCFSGILLSNDDLQSGIFLRSITSTYGCDGMFGLMAHNDSTLSWSDNSGNTTYCTYDDFKHVFQIKVSSDYYKPPIRYLTRNYFYSCVSYIPDTVIVTYAKRDSSAFGSHKVGGYHRETIYQGGLQFSNDSTGYMILTVASNSLTQALLKTENYGKSWSPVLIDSIKRFVDFQVTPTGDIYLLKKNGELYYSSDQATTWAQKPTVPTTSCTTIHALNKDTWLAGGQNGVLFKTLNGGVNWTLENSNTTAAINGIYNIANICYFVTSNMAVHKSAQPVGESEIGVQQHAKVFPNPSSGTFHIELAVPPPNSTSGLEVFNMLGKRVAVQEVHSPSTDLSLEAMPAGIYLLHIWSGNAEIRQRLYKTN